MKRLLWLIPLLLLLCACGDSPEPAHTDAADPSQIELPSPEVTAAQTFPAVTEPSRTEPPETQTLPVTTQTEPPQSEPPQTTEAPADPSLWQYGDTTPTWKPELADAYPADTECSAELLLEKWMTVEGLSTRDLDERGCGQLILVAAQPTDGVETLAVCFTRGPDGSFSPVPGLTLMHGHIGRNGVKHDRKRNTSTSPAGLWAISTAFGNELPPEGLHIPWRQVTPNSDWVCDENSIYFNTWQERGDPELTEEWSDDVEHLENYPKAYAYACVIEFNRPPDCVPNRGCAIFLHCSTGGTGGCVGLPRADMLSVLKWLDTEQNPYILITGVDSGYE
jgi:L,D-peptidoglycan transpeptidase YkuD (ErfK/YbiS/YcfS/YnhG family)